MGIPLFIGASLASAVLAASFVFRSENQLWERGPAADPRTLYDLAADSIAWR